ncbi:MAG: hydroxyethylthiazole kinase [Alphaproteobacteria bacterium]
MDTLSANETAAFTASLLETLRQQRPLVQNITNFVSMDLAANALLAIGASPAMVHAREEVEEFVRIASALTINIGTLSSQWLESMEIAATAASVQQKPWILDPVGVGATTFRNHAVTRLLRHYPTLIRGNASEILAVARLAGLTDVDAAPKGVDAANSTEEAEGFAAALASHFQCVVAATGEVDIITDGTRLVRLANGHPLMTRVTAIGCALSATAGAFVAITDDKFQAAAAAIAIYGVVGEMAAEGGALVGPGSFRVRFLDQLAAVEGADITARLKVVA